MIKNIPVLSLLPEKQSTFEETRKKAYRPTQRYRPSLERVLDASSWLRRTGMQDNDMYRLYSDAIDNETDEALVNFVTWALAKNYLPQPPGEQ